MQQRLPKMRARALNERHGRLPALAQLSAQPSDQLQTTGAAPTTMMSVKSIAASLAGFTVQVLVLQ